VPTIAKGRSVFHGIRRVVLIADPVNIGSAPEAL
jgi:hypothetical protein